MAERHTSTLFEQYWRRAEVILRNQPPKLHNVTLIVQYIVMFLKIKEYIAQSFNVAPTYAILLHKQIYCAVISRVYTLRLLLRFSLRSLKPLQVLSVHMAPCYHLISSVVCDIAMDEVLLLAVLLASFLSRKEKRQRPTH